MNAGGLSISGNDLPPAPRPLFFFGDALDAEASVGTRAGSGVGMPFGLGSPGSL